MDPETFALTVALAARPAVFRNRALLAVYGLCALAVLILLAPAYVAPALSLWTAGVLFAAACAAMAVRVAFDFGLGLIAYHRSIVQRQELEMHDHMDEREAAEDDAIMAAAAEAGIDVPRRQDFERPAEMSMSAAAKARG